MGLGYQCQWHFFPQHAIVCIGIMIIKLLKLATHFKEDSDGVPVFKFEYQPIHSVLFCVRISKGPLCITAVCLC